MRCVGKKCAPREFGRTLKQQPIHDPQVTNRMQSLFRRLQGRYMNGEGLIKHQKMITTKMRTVTKPSLQCSELSQKSKKKKYYGKI